MMLDKGSQTLLRRRIKTETTDSVKAAGAATRFSSYLRPTKPKRKSTFPMRSLAQLILVVCIVGSNYMFVQPFYLPDRSAVPQLATKEHISNARSRSLPILHHLSSSRSSSSPKLSPLHSQPPTQSFTANVVQLLSPF